MKKLIPIIGALAVLMLVPAMASANGPCGVDFNGPTACAINAPAAISGTIVQKTEQDYYVFWAPAGTQVAATITNAIAPTCTSSNGYCGELDMELDDASGENVTIRRPPTTGVGCCSRASSSPR